MIPLGEVEILDFGEIVVGCLFAFLVIMTILDMAIFDVPRRNVLGIK